MKQFNALSKLLNNIHHLNHNAWIYTNLDLWYKNLNNRENVIFKNNNGVL